MMQGRLWFIVVLDLDSGDDVIGEDDDGYGGCSADCGFGLVWSADHQLRGAVVVVPIGEGTAACAQALGYPMASKQKPMSNFIRLLY